MVVFCPICGETGAKTIDFVEVAAMASLAHLTTMILMVTYMGCARNFQKGEPDPSYLGA